MIAPLVGAKSYHRSMPAALLAVIVIAVVVVGVVTVRRTQRRAFVAHLPIGEGEQVILEEEGLKLAYRFRRNAVRGGWSVTSRVRSILTDRRILLATGGPEGKHKFVMLMILDYTTPASPVLETGYAAYRQKFGLENGYPTYACSAHDVSVDADDGEARLRVIVPFPEAGEGWGGPPEVRLSTSQAARYEQAIRGAGPPAG